MINTIQMINAWFAQAMRGFAGYTNAVDHEYFFDDSVDFEAQFGEDADLRDYFLELADGRRFRLYQVIATNQVEIFDPALELSLTGQRWWVRHMDDPPDHLWAEITYLDNRPTIESNFGRLIGFTLDDLAERTDNLDYLTAVQGLWSYVWGSRTLYRHRVSGQVILGLPFAEATGNIIDIERPFDASRDRILVQDADNPSIIRSYLFPSKFDIETSPETGLPYSLGDTVEQFAPLCRGVSVTDYVDDPDWIRTYVGSADMFEPQKVHTFGVVIDAEIFDLVNILFLSTFFQRYKPTYVDSFFVVLKRLSQTIDVDDPVLLGPAVPPSGYEYPTSWPAYSIPLGWSNSPHEVPRAASPTVPENLGIPFGGLRLADAPGKSPDGWAGSWPSGAAGSHTPTISEGSFRFDETDESGHLIHRYDEHKEAVNLLSDGTIESVYSPGHPSSPWSLVGAPSTASKVTGPVDPSHTPIPLSGSRALYIADSMGGTGVQQSISSTLTEGFQVGAKIWVYLVSGQAHFRILGQDAGATVLAEWRHAAYYKQWHRIHLHAWEASAYGGNFATLQLLTGPAGGQFYVDAEGAEDWEQVGMYEKAMPWMQWGYDRAISGRTGGYTQGGLPDEDIVFQIAIQVP